MKMEPYSSLMNRCRLHVGRVVIVTPDGLVPVERDIPLETIKRVRQTAKKRVFVTNSLRALASVSPTHNVRDIPSSLL